MPEFQDQAVQEFEHWNMARPWPRFWSRSLDTAIWAWPLGFATGYLFPTQTVWFSANDKQGYLLGIILMPLIMVADALCLALLGSTLGRAIVGIRVETVRHERLSVPTALKRNALVYVKGLGLGIPLVALFTQISGYNKIKDGEQTSWDTDLYTRVYDISSNLARTTICAILVVIAFTLPKIFEEIDRPGQIPATGSPLVPSEDPIEKQLKDAAAAVKPQMVDDITRLNSAEADGRTFIYNYTIIRRDASDAIFSRFFIDRIRPKICTGKETSVMLKDYQITYRYRYLMPNATTPLEFEVRWADCAQ